MSVKTKSDGFASVALVILIIGVIAFVAYMLGASSANVPQAPTLAPVAVNSPSPTAVASPALKAKTYKNTEYGFSFTYPEYYDVEENTQQSFIQVIINKQKTENVTVKATRSYTSDDPLYVFDTASSGERVINGVTWKEFSLKSQTAFALQTEKNKVLFTVIFSGTTSLNGASTELMSSLKFD